jgi:hypothetical protein
MYRADLIHEAQAGLDTYRREVVGAFTDYRPSIDPGVVRSVLAESGVVSQSPIVTIPFSEEAHIKLTDLRTPASWVDPAVHERFTGNKEKVRRRDAGEACWEVGMPTVFYSVLLDVGVVTDDFARNEEDLGKSFALGHSVADIAHEITHSAFARLTTHDYTQTGQNSVLVHTRYGIGQPDYITNLRRGGGEVPPYNPCWIDEAFAQRMAALVRQKIAPHTMPDKDRTLSLPAYGAEEFVLPPEYLIQSEVYPDFPSPLAGLEAVGLDWLDLRRPEVGRSILELVAGKMHIQLFHDSLKNSVGNELYRMMVERRPYDSWKSVFDAITEL